jgi:hypothetical protein
VASGIAPLIGKKLSPFAVDAVADSAWKGIENLLTGDSAIEPALAPKNIKNCLRLRFINRCSLSKILIALDRIGPKIGTNLTRKTYRFEIKNW